MTLGALWRLAMRDLWGGLCQGLAGFRVLLLGLTLGVAAVAAAGAVVAAVEAGLDHNARALLGGDVDVSRRYGAPQPQDLQRMAAWGRTAQVTTMRAMVRRDDGQGRAVLSELKAVDAAYPLVGQVRLAMGPDLSAAFAPQGGLPGLAVGATLLQRLEVGVGDVVRIGKARFVIRDVIRAEPDVSAQPFALGPRVMMNETGLAATGLDRPGSLTLHSVRILAPQGQALTKADVAAAFEAQGWRVRGLDESARGIRRFLDTIGRFLSWAGLTALLVGGVGVACAVTAVIEDRRATLAVLKTQGASNGQVIGLHALMIGAVAGLGVSLGAGLGALAPWPVAWLIDATALPAAPVPGFYPLPVLRAVGFGCVIAAVFAWWPLLRSRDVAAGTLLRDLDGQQRRPIPGLAWVVLVLLVAAGLGLAATVGDRPAMGLGFAVGAVAVLALLRGLVATLQHGVPLLIRRHTHVLARLTILGVARAGSPVVAITLALGLGATALVALVQVQGNVSAQVGHDRVADYPTYFFIDIQPGQADAFAALTAAMPGVRVVDNAPMVRGRVTTLAGVPANPDRVAPDVRWVLEGDRGFSSAAVAPREAEIVAGQWWLPDQTAALVSVERSVAEGLGLKIGDTIGVNILGRDVTATVANLRAVRWTSLAMNFAFIFSPGVIDGAPYTRIATVKADPVAEQPLERTMAAVLPNVSAIRVADVLEQAQSLADVGSRAILAVTAVTVLTGFVVLGGAIGAGLRERLDQAVVLKVLGARRRDLLRLTVWEFMGIGLWVGGFATVAGSLVAWLVVRQVMHLDWIFQPYAALGVALACVAIGIATGALVTARVLSARPARYLRHL